MWAGVKRNLKVWTWDEWTINQSSTLISQGSSKDAWQGNKRNIAWDMSPTSGGTNVEVFPWPDEGMNAVTINAKQIYHE